MTTIGSLFTGYGGLDHAVEAVTGGRTIWRSDIDPGANKIIAHHWPDDPNLGDISAVDWDSVEPVDIITGGSPCQDLSHAGRRGGMRAGTRSNLWVAMREAITELRPSLVVWENVRGAYSAAADSDVEPCPGCVGNEPGVHLRALGRVCGDLASIGYDTAWHGLTAASIGAPHGRFRAFLIGWPQSRDTDSIDRNGRTTAELAREAGPQTGSVADTDRLGHEWSGDSRRRWRGPADDSGDPSNTASAGLEGSRSEPAWGGSERGDRTTAADATGDGRHEGWAESAGIVRRHDAAECCGAVAWGQFEPAIRRWERLTRPAPAPTETSSRGGQRLSPRFVEWMMGLPAGHVTDVPALTRNEQLTALGNGVVPQQAEAALRFLLSASREAVA